MPPASVLLIDDHPIFLEGLRRVLESREGLTVVGETATIAAEGGLAVVMDRCSAIEVGRLGR